VPNSYVCCNGIATTNSTCGAVSCLVTTSPANLSLSTVTGGSIPKTGTVTATVTGLPAGRTISQMLFGAYNTNGAVVSVYPTSSGPPYQTTATGLLAGTDAVWATAQLSDGNTVSCQSTADTDTDITVSAGGTPVPPPPTSVPIPPGSCIESGYSLYLIGTKTCGTIGNCTSFTQTWPPYQTFQSCDQIGLYGVSNLNSDSLTPPTTNATPTKCFTNTCSANNVTRYAMGDGLCEYKTLNDCNADYQCVNYNCVGKKYAISGNVFVDTNENGKKDAGESNYPGKFFVSSTGGTVAYPVPSGSYSISGLPAGPYTVTFSGLVTGYRFTYPPSSLIVRVGSSCSFPITSEAKCTSGSMSDLNAGVTNIKDAWIQTTGSDLRWDSGFNNPLPSSTAYASIPGLGGMPGIIFSGASTPIFGLGQASQDQFNWKVGGSSADKREVFTDTHSLIPTSYRFLLETADGSGIVPAAITSLTNITAHGIYKAEGDLNVNADYTFPANQNFIILINGNLNINGKILVPIGSTAIFSAKGNITVGPSVGHWPEDPEHWHRATGSKSGCRTCGIPDPLLRAFQSGGSASSSGDTILRGWIWLASRIAGRREHGSACTSR